MPRSEQYDTTEWRCAIDLAELRQSKWTSGTVTWSSAGQGDYAFAQWALRTDFLTLSFNGGPFERFYLRRTSTAFGGTRTWLCCPGCDRNVRVVYRGRAGYRCRHCYSLRYPSQRERSHYRAISMAQRLRMRLGGSPDLSQPFPERPKGMHVRTYRCLLAKDEQWTNRWATGIMQTFGMV